MGEFLRNYTTMLPAVPDRKRTRSLSCMRIEKVVGSGTFGVVYKAVDKTEQGEPVVALKKIKMERETQGFPVTAIREIKILKQLRHPNVVALREIVTYDEGDETKEPTLLNKDLFLGDVLMVFEFVDFDLAGLLKLPGFTITPHHIQCYTHQLLLGLKYLHDQRVLHRDIKSANLLVTRQHVLKIADWGLARGVGGGIGGGSVSIGGGKLTVPVVTLWYRAPELILGSNVYSFEIDMWSAGCVFAELFMGQALFRCDSEGPQLQSIFSLLGSPQGAVKQTYEKLPLYPSLVMGEPAATPALTNAHTQSHTTPTPGHPMPTYSPRIASQLSSFLGNEALDLLCQMLHLCPKTRISSEAALDHAYFKTNKGGVIRPEQLTALRQEGMTDYLAAQDKLKTGKRVVPVGAAAAAGHPPHHPQHHHNQPQPHHQPGKPAPTMAGAQAPKNYRLEAIRKQRESDPQLKKIGIIKNPAAAAASAAPAVAAPAASAGGVATAGVGGGRGESKGDHDEPAAKKFRN